MAVPTTVLTVTDRLAVRYYVTHSGRTITLHTENSHLCQIITTFTTGLTALNGLTAQVQNFATGTSGTDFGISSSVSTHTFNLPDASASARGVVTTGTQTFAGYKIFTGTIGVNNDLQLAAAGTASTTFIKNISGAGLTSIGSNGFGFNNSDNIYFSGSSKGGGIIAFSNTGNQTYTLQDASGTLAFTSDISNSLTGYVTLATTQTITGAKTFDSTTSTFAAFNSTNASGGTLTFRRSGTNVGHIGNSGVLGVGILDDLEVRSGIGKGLHLKTDGGQLTLATGGGVTLTGALNGTSASFSGRISTNHSSSGDYAAVFYNTSATGEGVTIRGGSTSSHNALIVQPYNGATTLFNILATGAATFSSSVQATSFNTTNGNLSQSGFWGTQITAGTGSFANFALLDSGTNGIMYNPTGTLNMTFTGNVGIGTPAPSEKLFVEGSDVNEVGFKIKNNNISNGNKYLAIFVAGTSGFAVADWANSGVIESAAGTNSNLVLGNYENGPIIFQTNNRSEKMRITSDAYLRMAASTGGIQFNGDTAAANALDDYEEGTWTPVIGGSGGESGQSYGGQTGHYTKVGRLVTATFRVVLSNKGTITGSAAIKGLPFTISATVSHGSGVTYFEGLSTSWSYIFFMATGGETYATIDGIKSAATLTTRATTSDIGNSTQFNGSITYFV